MLGPGLGIDMQLDGFLFQFHLTEDDIASGAGRLPFEAARLCRLI